MKSTDALEQLIGKFAIPIRFAQLNKDISKETVVAVNLATGEIIVSEDAKNLASEIITLWS